MCICIPLSGKNVLILHALESNVPIFELTDRGLRVALDSGGMSIRNQFFQYLDLARNPGPEYRERLVDLMRLRYGHRKIDLLITLYPEALLFAIKEGRTIFPEAPIVALYLPRGFEQPQRDRRIIRQVFTPEMIGRLEIALNLVPGAKRVYVVSGANPVDRSFENRARQDFKKWEGRLEFRYLSNLPLDEILAAVSSAPPETIVFFMGFAADVTGKNYTTREVGKRLGEVSRVPVFGLYDVVLGYGIAGGSLISFEYVGTRAGELALDILRGNPTTKNILEFLDVPPLPMFDWRQLRDELAQLTRIAMMRELTTALAHEINQPLTAILSNAEAAQRFLSQASPDISEVRQILEDIVRDDRRANDVVRKVRALVKKEKVRAEPLDLNEVIGVVVDLIRADSLLQGLSIDTDLIPQLAVIRGDGIQLQQVILNLILNGAAAMRNSR